MTGSPAAAPGRAPTRARGAAVAVAAAALVLQLPIYDRWLSLMDEGHMLQFADLIAKGGELYRDATVYPLPGAFYLLALVFRVVTPSILVARWIVVVEFTVLAVCVLLLLRRVVPPALALAGVGLLLLYRVWAFPHWHMYSYSSTALCLLAGALVALMRFVETETRRPLVAAGALAALAIVCKQDYGVAALVAMNLVLLVHARAAGRVTASGLVRRLVCFDGPALAAAAVLALHFWRQGLLAEMFRLTVWGHLRGIATFRYTSLPPLLPLLHQNPALRDMHAHVVYAPPILFTVDWPAVLASALYRETIVWDLALKAFFYGPYVLVVAAAVRLWRGRAALGDPGRRVGYVHELALAAFAAALLLSLTRPRDYVHLAVLYWPSLCLLVLEARALAGGRRARVLAIGGAALLLAVPLAGYTARLAWRLRTVHPTRLEVPRAQVYAKPAEAEVVDDVVRYIQAGSAPEDPVAVFPYFPLVSFLAERRGPHRSGYVVWPVPEPLDREPQIIAALEATDTRLVVYHVTQWVQFPPFEQYVPALFSYLVEHFEIERVFSAADPWSYVFLGLRRRPAPPAGRVLPVADPALATVRVEQPGAPPRTLPAEERAAFVATARWPFTEVVALRPLAGGGRTILAVPVTVPAGAHLRTAVGVHARRWVSFTPAAVTFSLAVVDGGRREQFAARTLDPQRRVADRGWFEIDAPLAAYAGRTIVLEFGAAVDRPEGEALDLAGWAVPRLVVP